MAGWRELYEYATTEGVPRRALWTAVVVGTILNLINQGDALVAGHPLQWVKLGLTYLVPYGVATYGAVSFRLAAARLSRRRAGTRRAVNPVAVPLPPSGDGRSSEPL